MKLVIEFMKSILSMKPPWPVWVAGLMGLNMVGPLFFIQTPEAQAVLAATLAGAIFMMFLFSRYGFVRLLGLGHIFWVPLVVWLWGRFSEIGLNTTFGIWLTSVLVVNILSLIIDLIDVSLYIRGDRRPMEIASS